MTDTDTDSKGRRVTIDLTPAASKEVDRLKRITGLSTANLFRYALTLFRDCVDGTQRGKEIRLIDPSSEQPDERLRLPIIIDETSSRRQPRERTAS